MESVLISEEQIKNRISELAKQIAQDYKDQNILLIGVLNGSFIFFADLVRELWKQGLHDCEVDFVRVKSYGMKTVSSKNPLITKDLEVPISHRHIIIVDDIVDTGYTIQSLMHEFKKRNPASVKIVSLISKPSRREGKITIDYLGFEIDDKWVIGYGMDDMNTSRGIPHVEEKVS